MTPEISITFLAIAVGGMLGLVLISGRLGETWRRRIKAAVVVLLYPALIVNWSIAAVREASEDEWLFAILHAGLAFAFTIAGFFALRERRLWPKGLHP